MMKRKLLLATLIFILVLTGCNKETVEQEDSGKPIPTPATEVIEP